LNNLTYLSLSENKLCGNIPLSLMNLMNLDSYSSLSLQNNHLTASDPDFIDWLNNKNPDWITQTPCTLVYALHGNELNDAQFFTINPNKVFEVNAVGPMHSGYDFESLAMHPQTKTLYTVSNKHPEKELEYSYLYKVRYADATLTSICSTGLSDVSAMSFHPQEGRLWVWDNVEGLFTINLDLIEEGVCEKTEIFRYIAPVEGLAWDDNGKKLYSVVDTTLYQYFHETGTMEKVCDDFPSPVKALDTLTDGLLLFALHQANDTRLQSFDINSCSVKDSVSLPAETQYTEIEGLTWSSP
jgi:hypothetical protein